MKKNYLAFLFVVAAINGFAQDDSSNVQPMHHTWAIKGKVLPWSTLIIPFQGINYTLGVEYGFGKLNAVGVDLVYNDNSSHQDYYDTVKKEDATGPNMYSVSRGVFLYYKRYLDLKNTLLYKPMVRITGDSYLPYISPFVRYGKKDYHYDAGYETSNVSYDEWQYSAGFLVGAVSRFFDFNIGPFYKQTYISDVEKVQGVNVLQSSVKPSLGFRVGINVFFIVRKKGDHVLAKYKTDKYKEAWDDLSCGQ